MAEVSIRITKTMKPAAVEAAKAWNVIVKKFKKADREYFEMGVARKCLKCAGLCKQAAFATVLYCPQFKKV
jgi:hypothetical protein